MTQLPASSTPPPSTEGPPTYTDAMYLQEQDAPPDDHRDRPYHAKRPHRKSRRGCRACKARKVKCDEARPACRNCVLRKEECAYLAPSSSPSSTSSLLSPADTRASRSVSPRRPDDPAPALVSEPGFRPADKSMLDMKLLWWYSTFTYTSFISEWAQPRRAHTILQYDIPRRAFETPFLMDIVLCLSACHMHALQPGDISPAGVVSYRARAFEGYRRAIEQPRKGDHAGLLAGSLLLTAVASQTFREADVGDLYILDWMVVWRGIGTVIGLTPQEAFRKTGMAELFYRPAVDLEAAAAHVPAELAAMVASIPPGDDEFPCVGDYGTTLLYLGSLHRELRLGKGPVLYLQTVTWFTSIPSGFVEAARARRPRALVILAHYLAFHKMLNNMWWLTGIGDRGVAGIARHLGPEWAGALEVPCRAVAAGDSTERARVLLRDPAWVAGEEYRGTRMWVDTDDELVCPPAAECD